MSGTRASMQSRLEALSTVTSVSVTKSTVSTTGRQFLITFTTPSDTVEMSSATAHSSCETFSGATPTFAITSTGGIGSRADGNYFCLHLTPPIQTGHSTLATARRLEKSIGQVIQISRPSLKASQALAAEL